MRKLIILSGILSAVLIFTACEQPLSPSAGAVPAGSEPAGILVIKDGEPQAATVVVSGVSADGEKMGLRSFEASRSVEVDGVPPGEWTLYYNYADAQGNVLSYGRSSLTVRSGRKATLSAQDREQALSPDHPHFGMIILHLWFEPVFEKYRVDQYGSHYGRFIRHLTYRSVTGFLYGSRSLTARRVWLEKRGLDPAELVTAYIDIMFWFDQEGFMAPMLNEILALFKANMYHYYNVSVPYLIETGIAGLPEDLILNEGDEYPLSPDPVVRRVDYDWYLNEVRTASGPHWTLTGAAAASGENRLRLQGSYREVVLGQKEVTLIKKQTETRPLLADIPFASDDLRRLVLSSGYTYVDELTVLVIRDYPGIDLSGLELLTGLTTLRLVNLGLATLADVRPVLDLLEKGGITDLRLVGNPLEPEAVQALEALFPGSVS